MPSSKKISPSGDKISELLARAEELQYRDVTATIEVAESALDQLTRELWRHNIDVNSLDAARLEAAPAVVRARLTPLCDLQLLLAKAYYTVRRPPESIAAETVAWRLAELLNDRRRIADVLCRQSERVGRSNHNYTESMEQAQRALELYRSCEDPAREVFALSRLASQSTTRDSLDDAKRYIEEGLNCEGLERFPTAHFILLSSLSSVEHNLGNLDVALAAGQQALELSIDNGLRHSQASALNRVGAVLLNLGRSDEALAAHEEACEIFRSVPSRTGEAFALQFCGIVLSNTGRIGEALDQFLALVDIYQELGDGPEEARTYNNIANALHSLGQYGRSLHYARQSLALHKDLNISTGAAIAHSHIANSLGRLGRYDQALANFNSATTIHRKARVRFQEVANLANTAQMYLSMGNREKHFEVSRQVYAIAQQHKYHTIIAWGSLSLGNWYEHTGDLQRAEQHYKEGLELAVESNDPRGQASAFLGLGRIQQKKANFDEALANLEHCLALHESMNDQAQKAGARIAIAQVHTTRGNFTAAHAVLDTVLAEAEAADYLQIIPELHKEKAAAYEAEGKLAEALEQFKLFNSKQLEQHNRESREQLNNLQVAEDLEKARYEAEMQKQQRQLVEKELDLQRRELMSHTMITSRNGELLREVYAGLNKLQKSGKYKTAEVNSVLANVLDKLEPRQQSAQDWEAFEQRFSKIHSSFLPKLRADFPALSPVETKVCSLLKLNLNIKEMAELLSVGADTIKKHRYNVRRKLGLKKGENLTSFFADY